MAKRQLEYHEIKKSDEETQLTKEWGKSLVLARRAALTPEQRKAEDDMVQATFDWLKGRGIHFSGVQSETSSVRL